MGCTTGRAGRSPASLGHLVPATRHLMASRNRDRALGSAGDWDSPANPRDESPLPCAFAFHATRVTQAAGGLSSPARQRNSLERQTPDVTVRKHVSFSLHPRKRKGDGNTAVPRNKACCLSVTEGWHVCVFLGEGKRHAQSHRLDERHIQRNTCPSLARGTTRAGPSGGEPCQRRGQMHPMGTLSPRFCYCSLGIKQPGPLQTRELFLATTVFWKIHLSLLSASLCNSRATRPLSQMHSSYAVQMCSPREPGTAQRAHMFNNMFKTCGLLLSSLLSTQRDT